MESRDSKVDDGLDASMPGLCCMGTRRFYSGDVEVLNRVQDDRGCAGGVSLFVFGGERRMESRDSKIEEGVDVNLCLCGYWPGGDGR